MKTEKVESAFIVHGAFGSPQINWFPWLKATLKDSGIDAYAPQFPIGDQQSLSNWTKAFDEYKKEFNERSIMIGHSIGPAFILSVIERLDFKIPAAFLVAPFVQPTGSEKYDKVNATFYRKYDWDRIKKNCKRFYVYVGDNDPYVSMELSKFVAKNLDAEITLIPNGGHLNGEFGYREFPELLNDIMKLAGK